MKKLGFTLAETLIVLAIIGVVASLTVPNVIKRYQEQEIVNKIRKFYSDINQAFSMAAIYKGKIENYKAQTNKDLYNYFKPYIKTIKECDLSSTECFYNGNYKALDAKTTWYHTNPNRNIYYKAIINNGVSLAMNYDGIWTNGKHCINDNGTSKSLKETCGSIIVDINGYKKPNQIGVDTFYFWITTGGVIPAGTNEDTHSTLTDNCDFKKNNNLNGSGCTAWAIVKGNMDYLRKNVSW